MTAHKCAIFPPRPLEHEEVGAARYVEAELRRCAPLWLAAPHCAAAKYLGLMLGLGRHGPQNGRRRWRNRTAASSASRRVHWRHLPVTGDVAQFSPLAAADERRGIVVATRLLHMPANSIPCCISADLRRLGMPPEFAASAALVGAASRLRGCWHEAWTRLEHTMEAHMPIGRWAESAPSPPGWQAVAICRIGRSR